MSATTGRRLIATVVTIAGLGLFALALHAADPAGVADALQRIGVGFLLVLAVSGVRLAARAGAWAACSEAPARLPFRSAFHACVVGEALGNVTPLGLAASEPAKVLWVRSFASGVEAAASLTVETAIYTASVAVVIVIGTAATLIAMPLSATTRVIGLGAIGGGLLACALPIPWLRGPNGLWHRTLRALDARAVRHPRLRIVGQWLQRVELIAGHLAARRPVTLILVSAAELVFQVAAVAEVYIVLACLGVQPTLLQALCLEYADRVVTVVFKFIPFRLGVDEVASGVMAKLVGTGGTLGVSVAIVRKARVLFWSALGLTLLGARSWRQSREQSHERASSEVVEA